MTNEELHDLTAAYALDALDADERRAYEEHLAGCERCRGDLAEFGETVGALGLAAEGPAPPEALRDRILVAAHTEGPSNVVAFRPRRRLYAITAVAAVAAVGLAIGLTVALSGGSSKPSMSVAVSQGVTQATIGGLKPAPSGKVYEIWVIEGGTPQRAGLIRGGEKQTVTLTRPAPNGSTVAVTLERAGGVDAPTSEPVVSTTVSA
jgi:anti-sigma-K factor RskA